MDSDDSLDRPSVHLPGDPLVDRDLPALPGGEVSQAGAVPPVLDDAEDTDTLTAYACVTCFSSFLLPTLPIQELRRRSDTGTLCPYTAQHQEFLATYEACKRSRS